MNLVIKQTLALSISVAISAPLFALGGLVTEMAEGRIPWIAGSLFLSALWALFLGLVIFAPVATVSCYLIEHRISVRWFAEPFVVFGVLCLITIPLGLSLVGWHPTAILFLTASLFIPTLIYYLLLRAIGLREYR